jgi:hypothetical protein
MRKLSFLFLLILICKSLTAQQVLCEIEQGKMELVNINGFEVGDSLLLNIAGRVGVIDVARAETNYEHTHRLLWVLPSGEIKYVSSNFPETVFCAGYNKGDSVFLYYLVESKKQIGIKIFAQSKTTGQFKLSEKTALVEGQLLGLYYDHGLFVISSSKKDYSIHVSKLNRLNIVDKKIFNLSFEILKKGKEDLVFIPEGVEPLPEIANYRTKIYKIKESIIICSDELPKDSHSVGRTTLAKLNLKSGDSQIKTFLQSGNFSFRTFLSNTLLFSVHSDKGIIIKAIDYTSGKEISSAKIDDESTSFIHYPCVYRNGAFNYVTNDLPVTDAIHRFGNYFISATYNNDSSYVIKVGDRHLASTEPLLPRLIVLGGFGLKRFLLYSQTQAGVAYYFYMDFDKNNNAHYLDTPESLSSLVDRYEMQDRKENRFSYKSYLMSKECAYAFYKETGTTKLKVVKFSKK